MNKLHNTDHYTIGKEYTLLMKQMEQMMSLLKDKK